MTRVVCVMLFGLLCVCIVRAMYANQYQVLCKSQCDPSSSKHYCEIGCVCYRRTDNPQQGTCGSPSAPIPPSHQDSRQTQTPNPKPGPPPRRTLSYQSLPPWKPDLPPRPASLGSRPLATRGGLPGARPQFPVPGMSTASLSPPRLQSPGPHPLPQMPSVASARPTQGAKVSWQTPQSLIHAGSKPSSPVRGSREASPHPPTPVSPPRRPLPPVPVPQPAPQSNPRLGSPARVTSPEEPEERPYLQIIK
uniref:Putative proline-rich receptor-like protein kinase perk2 n=1 Tax=Amblyomma triste TaxID=251400 RepID=A0A023G383_AMBTT